MSYIINKTNGELVVDLADGQIDNTTTDITLVGRNYKGFGEFINENFVKIIENFANINPPNSPLRGQLWYDTVQETIKVYDGTSFRPAGGPVISPTTPGLSAGDLWIDNSNRQLYFYDGNSENEITLVGPGYNINQGKTGFETVSLIDDDFVERTVIKLFLGKKLLAIISANRFRLSKERKIPDYPDDSNDDEIPPRQLIEKGINVVDADFDFVGTAESARFLIDETGSRSTLDNFIRSDRDEETAGSLFIKNSNGLSVGVGDNTYASFKVLGNTTAIESQRSNSDIVFRTKIDNQFFNTIYLDADKTRVGVLTTTPQYTLDLNGDLRTTGNTIIDGNLTVNGESTYVNATTLTINDKNIELGLLDDSTEASDNDVDNAGIIVRSSAGSKDFLWKQETNSFYTNVNLDLLYGNTYKINGKTVLSETSLPTITDARNLVRIGNLEELGVDSITIDDNTISSSNQLNLTSAEGIVSASNSRITNLADPGNLPNDETDAVNRKYVDNQINSIDISLCLDITGLEDPFNAGVNAGPYNSVANILENISPAVQKSNGVHARIHCTSYDNLTAVEIDVESALSTETISVLAENGGYEPVVYTIEIDPVTGDFISSPNRFLMVFKVSNGVWEHDSTENL